MWHARICHPSYAIYKTPAKIKSLSILSIGNDTVELICLLSKKRLVIVIVIIEKHLFLLN